MAYPTHLPRFAESFRIMLDHPRNPDPVPSRRIRMLSGEWEGHAGFHRAIQDFVPDLSKVGLVNIIASTAPTSAHGREGRREWYGDPDAPVLYWYWMYGATEWEWPGEETCRAFAKRQRLPLELLRIPAGEDVPLHIGNAVAAMRR